MNKSQVTSHKLQVVVARSPVLRESARKIRTNAKTIARMSPKEAVGVLAFFPNRPAEALRKTIKQAIANATNNLKLPEQALSSMNIQVEEGPTMKRFRIGGRGRVKPVLKRTSRIVVRLMADRKEGNTKPRNPA